MKTNQSFVRVLFARVGRLTGFLFGQISWSAPPWLEGCGRRAEATFGRLKAQPRVAVLSLLLVAALGTGAWQGWRWWDSHKPRTFDHNASREVTVTIQAPGAVPCGAPDKDLTPEPLRITFAGGPVTPSRSRPNRAANGPGRMARRGCSSRMNTGRRTHP